MTNFDKLNRDESRSEKDADSLADMYALLGLVVIVVSMAVYFVSR
jgi:hypothetical protein